MEKAKPKYNKKFYALLLIKHRIFGTNYMYDKTVLLCFVMSSINIKVPCFQ